MKRALELRPWAESFSCFVSSDLRPSLIATSEPSAETWSPPAISESNSTCSAGELAIETGDAILALSPPDSFNCRSQLRRSSCIPELGGLVQACRQDWATVRTKRRRSDNIPMVEGSDQLARGRIPELAGIVPARCQDLIDRGTERSAVHASLMLKGGNELTRSRIPELGGFRSALAVRIRAPSGLIAALSTAS